MNTEAQRPYEATSAAIVYLQSKLEVAGTTTRGPVVVRADVCFVTASQEQTK
jgi:hypothetical protein